MADYLRDQLGGKSICAYNHEDFGPNSLLGRGSDPEVVPTRYLRGKLQELNPGLPATAYDEAVAADYRHDFLWSDETGLPVDYYDEDEVGARAEEV